MHKMSAAFAGTPGLVFEMQEIVKLLLKDPAYMRVGARCPRVSCDSSLC
jgi:hypothetical protein